MKEEKKQTRLAIIKGAQKNHKTEQVEDALCGAYILEGQQFKEENNICTYYTRSNIVEPSDYVAGMLCTRRNKR